MHSKIVEQFNDYFDDDIIQQSSQLLNNYNFSISSNITFVSETLEGDRVKIGILTEPSSEDTPTVKIVCLAYGHRQVNWQQLRLQIVAEKLSYLVPTFDPRGIAKIQLSPGKYQFKVLKGLNQITSSYTLPLSVNLQQQAANFATNTDAEVIKITDLPLRSQATIDISMDVSTYNETLYLDFETSNSDYQDMCIEVFISNKESNKLLVQTVTKAFHLSNTNKWTTAWSGKLSANDVFKIAFQILQTQ